jgi:hypothetical protein
VTGAFLPLAEIIGIDLAKGLCAKSNGEKGFIEKKLSKGF